MELCRCLYRLRSEPWTYGIDGSQDQPLNPPSRLSPARTSRVILMRDARARRLVYPPTRANHPSEPGCRRARCRGVVHHGAAGAPAASPLRRPPCAGPGIGRWDHARCWRVALPSSAARQIEGKTGCCRPGSARRRRNPPPPPHSRRGSQPRLRRAPSVPPEPAGSPSRPSRQHSTRHRGAAAARRGNCWHLCAQTCG